MAARLAVPGSKLGASEVSRITTTVGEVINPLTASGKILTQGGVIATTCAETAPRSSRDRDEIESSPDAARTHTQTHASMTMQTHRLVA